MLRLWRYWIYVGALIHLLNVKLEAIWDPRSNDNVYQASYEARSEKRISSYASINRDRTYKLRAPNTAQAFICGHFPASTQ